MAKQTINQGTAPFGEGGDDIRVGTAKLQANDDEIYAFLGAGADGVLNQAAARAAIGLGSVDNTSDVNKPISTATQNALNQKANTVDVNTALAAKANTIEVNTALAGKADLVGGIIPTSQIPAIAITEFLGNVATEAAMLALVGQKGDWCIRTDMGKAYIITGTTPSLITDWTEWVYPVSPVTSVNGQVGVVTLNYTNVGADAAGSAATVQSNLDTHAGNLLNPHGVTKAQVGLGDVDNTSDLNKPISTATQTALNAKADLVSGKVPNNQLQSASTTQSGITQLVNDLITGGVDKVVTAEALKAFYSLFVGSYTGFYITFQVPNINDISKPMLIQIGSVAGSYTANTDVVITFSKAFPNSAPFVMACNGDMIASSGAIIGVSQYITKTAFAARSNVSGAQRINYIAIGN